MGQSLPVVVSEPQEVLAGRNPTYPELGFNPWLGICKVSPLARFEALKNPLAALILAFAIFNFACEACESITEHPAAAV